MNMLGKLLLMHMSVKQNKKKVLANVCKSEGGSLTKSS